MTALECLRAMEEETCRADDVVETMFREDDGSLFCAVLFFNAKGGGDDESRIAAERELWASADAISRQQVAYEALKNAQERLLREQACAEAAAVLIGLKRYDRAAVLQLNPKDVVAMIARHVWATKDDSSWMNVANSKRRRVLVE